MPELRAADLGRGGVLHEVVDRRGAVAPQPRVHVLQRDRNVEPDPRLGHPAAIDMKVQDVGCGDVHFGPQALLLVRAIAEHAVEDFGRQRHQVRVRQPRAVEAIA